MVELIFAHKSFSGLTAITVTFLIAASFLVSSNRSIGHKERSAFVFCLVSLTFIALFDWANYLLAGTHPEFRPFHLVTMAVTFAVAPMLPVSIAHAIFPPSKAFRWVGPILIAQAVLEVATIFLELVFTVDATNTYHRGNLYIVYMATYCLSAIYLSVQSIRAGATYQCSSRLTICAILFVLFSGVIIQIVDPSVRTTWPSVAMAVVLYFVYYCEMVFTTDSLTMLLNRHSYDEFLRSPQLPCTIVAVDVNLFKQVNDTHGHAFGDVCLATIAQQILRVYSRYGKCYRTGGDEFTVVLTSHQDRVDALEGALVESLDKARQKEPRLPGVSQGHASADVGCTDIKSVIEQADQMMYERKRTSR